VLQPKLRYPARSVAGQFRAADRLEEFDRRRGVVGFQLSLPPLGFEPLPFPFLFQIVVVFS